MLQKFTPANSIRVHSDVATAYKVLSPLSDFTADAHLRFCVEAKRPRLFRQTRPHMQPRASVVGYGPSLLDTWKDIPRPIITTSGAHDFLIERGIIPDYHVETDSRIGKLAMLTPHKDVKYRIASMCHPFIWHKLADYDVEYFHALDGQRTVDWIAKNDTGSVLLPTGALTGFTAIGVADMLGWTSVDAFGLDCCAINGKWHAGEHHNTPQKKPIRVLVGTKFYQSSKTLISAAMEFEQKIGYATNRVHFHGGGMLGEIAYDAGWRTQLQKPPIRESEKRPVKRNNIRFSWGDNVVQPGIPMQWFGRAA